MHFLELKAKVKSGKEKELNQVINDLIPNFHSSAKIESQIYFNKNNGELNLKLINGNTSDKIEEIYNDSNFILLFGSIKVLCDSYALTVPKEISN